MTARATTRSRKLSAVLPTALPTILPRRCQKHLTHAIAQACHRYSAYLSGRPQPCPQHCGLSEAGCAQAAYHRTTRDVTRIPQNGSTWSSVPGDRGRKAALVRVCREGKKKKGESLDSRLATGSCTHAGIVSWVRLSRRRRGAAGAACPPHRVTSSLDVDIGVDSEIDLIFA